MFYVKILIISNEMVKQGDKMERDAKFEIITEGQKYGVSTTCSKYGISRTLYYRWLNRFKANGIGGLDPVKKAFIPVNKTPLHITDSVITLIKRYPSYGPREIKYLLEEIGHDISESAVYNIMKRHGLSTKDKRTRFARKRIIPQTSNLPHFELMKSGECWLFWTTPYGNHKHSGTLYEYTIFDYKSKIACSRLYDRLSLECFEDLLTAVAIPVAQSLSFETRHLCFFDDYDLPQKVKNALLANIQKTALSSGFDIAIHLIQEEEQRCELIDLKKAFTHHCLSYLMPFIHSERPLAEIKIMLQRHIRNYNLNFKSKYGEHAYSPIEYHSIATCSGRILPLWAYIDRLY